MPLIGNDEVIGLLEYWLEEAKKEEILYVALGAVKLGDQVAYDHAGLQRMEPDARIALKALDYDLASVINSRKLDPRDYNLDASYVEYHLKGATPICWDFLIWLIDAEMTRRRLKGPPPLKVHFSGVEELKGINRKFFENVYRPLLPLIGAIEDVNAKGGRHKPVYVPIDIVTNVRAGEEIPILKAPEEAEETLRGWLHGTKPVVITLREAEHYPHRNSQLEEWLKFATDLKNKGEEVIFLRDTLKAIEPLPGFTTCPIASFNIHRRMALYEQAKVNLLISNGPAGLCLFSRASYLYFVNLQKNDKLYVANNSEWWLKSNGITTGEQWPWATENQKMIWKRDTYKNISEEWERFAVS